MKTTSYLSAMALGALLAISPTAFAQNGSMPATNSPKVDTKSDATPTKRQAGSHMGNTNLARADRHFFEEAAKSGMKEVEVSNAVKARLADAQVRNFAEMMVADHTAANSELQSLAASKGFTLPVEKKDFAAKWADKDKDLDKDYVETMEDDHEDAVKLFQKASRSEDAEIAAFAQKTLPKLQHHLETVRTLKQTVK